MQKWHVMRPAMKCPACGRASAKLYETHKETGASRCPNCGTLHVASFRKHQLKARLSVN